MPAMPTMGDAAKGSALPEVQKRQPHKATASRRQALRNTARLPQPRQDRERIRRGLFTRGAQGDRTSATSPWSCRSSGKVPMTSRQKRTGKGCAGLPTERQVAQLAPREAAAEAKPNPAEPLPGWELIAVAEERRRIAHGITYQAHLHETYQTGISLAWTI